MAKKEADPQKFYMTITAIVAIIAVVGLIFMFSGTGGVSTGVSEADIAGQAFQIGALTMARQLGVSEDTLAAEGDVTLTASLCPSPPGLIVPLGTARPTGYKFAGNVWIDDVKYICYWPIGGETPTEPASTTTEADDFETLFYALVNAAEKNTDVCGPGGTSGCIRRCLAKGLDTSFCYKACTANPDAY